MIKDYIEKLIIERLSEFDNTTENLDLMKISIEHLLNGLEMRGFCFDDFEINIDYNLKTVKVDLKPTSEPPFKYFYPF